MEIRKKTWPDLFQQVLNGEKPFDVRLADWNCKKGDILVLEEYNPKTKQYTGRIIKKKIKYVLKTKDLPYWTEQEIKLHGFQVIALD